MRAGVLALVALVAIWGAACSGGCMEATSLGDCTAVGQQCDLGQGVLGVCFDAGCPPGATPPCFTCAKQH